MLDPLMATEEAPPSGGDTRTPILRRRKPGRRRRARAVPEAARVSAMHERVFLHMYLRKMERRVGGTQRSGVLCCEIGTFFVLTMVSVGIWVSTLSLSNTAPEPAADPEPGSSQGLSGTEILIIILAGVLGYIMFIVALFFVFWDSFYVPMLRYMGLYIPLGCLIIAQVLYPEVRRTGDFWAAGFNATVVVYIVAQVLFFVGFMAYHKAFPRFMTSAWVREHPDVVSKLWRVRLVEAWTMRYRGYNPAHGVNAYQLHYTCKYEGGLDPDTGLPDGLGRWLDDAREGETLTGYWKQGTPVAPFSTWGVGTDDAIVAVRVAYFKATDDEYGRNKFFPTNHLHPPECGVASVECSVSGSFYKHLPRATLIEGPLVVDAVPGPRSNPVREVLSHLFHVGEAPEDARSSVTIQASDPRGVQVLGHVYGDTGRFHSPDATQITVDVEWGSLEEGTEGAGSRQQRAVDSTAQRRPSARGLNKELFMPRSTPTPLSTVVDVANEDSSEEEESNIDHQRGANDDEGQDHALSRRRQLRVKDWVPYMYKEALVFCPGYNSCLEDSLKNFGQFLAMTKLSQQVYPIVFAWPGSKGVGYPYASKISATDINQRSMLKLVKGLGAAGVKRIHFMTHSMGVQTLLGAFRDKYDEHGTCLGRSDVSLCFQLDPEFDDTAGPLEGKRDQYADKMVCKSVTLLNADFPVRAFVDRAFLSVRRVCRTVTVVGDHNDRALRWSSLINGIAPKFGYEDPEVLRPSMAPYEHRWTRMERVGCSIEQLHFSAAVGRQYHDSGNAEAFRRQLFDKEFDEFGADTNDTDDAKLWLDMDVIDMTGLDTNIKGMRHSGFSLNGMLLKDLEELLSSGKRASRRSTLLYREGNMFSYAHAPAFVAV